MPEIRRAPGDRRAPGTDGERPWDLPVAEGADGKAPLGPSGRQGRLRRQGGHGPVAPLKYAPVSMNRNSLKIDFHSNDIPNVSYYQ